MNGRRSKKIRKQSSVVLVSWLKSLLDEAEASKVTLDNYKSMLPQQTHIYANMAFRMSAYTPRWVAKKIKKILKEEPLRPIESITWDTFRERSL